MSGISSAPGICAAIAIFFGRLWPPPKPPPAKPLRIDVTSKSPARSSNSALRGVGDVVERVAAQQHRDVVLLEDRRVGIARKAPRREQRVPLRAPVERRVLAPRARHEPLEVRQAPRDRDAEAGGRRLEIALEPGERVLQHALRGREIARRHAVTRAVTTSWWSGGTMTSTSLSVTVRTPSRTCCSGRQRRGRRALGRGAGQAGRRARRRPRPPAHRRQRPRGPACA